MKQEIYLKSHDKAGMAELLNAARYYGYAIAANNHDVEIPPTAFSGAIKKYFEENGEEAILVASPHNDWIHEGEVHVFLKRYWHVCN